MVPKSLFLLIFFLILISETKAYDILPLDENIKSINCEIKTFQDLKRFSEGNTYVKKQIWLDSLDLPDTLNKNNSFLDSIKIDSSKVDSIKFTKKTTDSNKIKLHLNDDKEIIQRKNVVALSTEMVLLQLIPLGIAKFITKPGWEKISFKSWWDNIIHGFTYDTDNFLTNHFSHPYHGSLYFNAARTNGYGFWESAPFAFLGSAVFEYFGETFRPSINDWINTSVSGVNLGEMTYRISNMITDNRATGSERVWREILGGIINPVRGVNRLITGEASRVFANTPLRKPKYFSFSVNAGIRRIINQGSDISRNTFLEGLFGFDVNYGDQFESDLKIPFSIFFVTASISNKSSYRVSDLRSYGILTGWKLREDEKIKHSLSILLSYDFASNSAYEFGGPSLSANLGSKYEFNKKFNVIGNVNAGLLLMGGTPDDFYNGAEGRNYDLGTGLIVRAYASLNGPGWQYASLSYTTFWFWTESGTPDSKHHVYNFNATGTLPINAYFAIGGSLGTYWRTSRYVIQGEVRRTSPIARLFAILKF
jgi:hypothetical protein